MARTTTGAWIKANWWVAIAGVLGALLTVLGIGLPFEDRTVGAAIGGIVIASLGISMLAGIRIRRRNRRIGALMMAVGTLPTFPFFWTIVLPLLGLLVFIPALLEISDAEAQGPAGANGTPPPPPPSGGPDKGSDPWLVVAFGMLAVGAVVALGVGSQAAAAGLCAPPLALVVGRLAARRLRMPSRLADIGLTFFVTGLAHAVLMAVVAIGGDPIDLGHPVIMVPGFMTSTAGAAGLVAFVIGVASSRGQARPA